MIRTVWKINVAELLRATTPTIALPVAARVLHVAYQRHELCVWVEVDPSVRKVDRQFYICPTGGEIPANALYCGTGEDQVFVWHVYISPESS